jgi:arylformamidase
LGQSPGPDREFGDWITRKKLIHWEGVECGSAEHPMNTIIRDGIPRQGRRADELFQTKSRKGLADFFGDSVYPVVHRELSPHGIIHAECIGGDIDRLLYRRVTIGLFPRLFVDGEISISRCVVLVDDDESAEWMRTKAGLPKTRFGHCNGKGDFQQVDPLSPANYA